MGVNQVWVERENGVLRMSSLEVKKGERVVIVEDIVKKGI